MNRIFYAKPSITELEIRYATDAAAHGWGEHCYDYIHRFERAFADHLGVRHTIATSSCTGALHLGLAGLGIGPGDEVIVADVNWIATVAPIVHLGALPVFVDIRADTWCIEPAAAEAAITPRTKAIIAVHLYGNLCDMDALLAIGKRYGIPVIEDAAEAIGSVWHGKRAGSMGFFSAFSFHGSKTITTGEGGMLATCDPDFYERVLTLSNHGRARGETRQFWPLVVGYKYRMSNLQAAIGCAQLERIDELVAGKRRVFKAYQQRLADLALDMNPEPMDTVNGFWMPTIVVHEQVAFDRDQLLNRFRADNIDGRVFFAPISSLPPFRAEPKNKVSERLSRRGMNLPSFHDLGEREIERVTAIVRERITEYARL